MIITILFVDGAWRKKPRYVDFARWYTTMVNDGNTDSSH